MIVSDFGAANFNPGSRLSELIVVYKATHVTSKNTRYNDLIMNEIEALMKINHDNIVKMLDYEQWKKRLHLVLTLTFFNDIIRGLSYCHNALNIAG